MPAITTTYKGSTNTKGSRIIAKSWLKSKSVSWHHALSSEENHRLAAQALIEDLNAHLVQTGQEYKWKIVAEGTLPDGKGVAYIIDLVKLGA